MSPRVGSIGIKAVHVVAPLGRDVSVWRSELRTMPPADTHGHLRMLLGDFNATLDHRELRSLLDTGYADAADAAGVGLRGTYRAGRRFAPPIAIDHLFVDSRARVTAASVHAMPGSDHRALVASISLSRAGA